jgi:hypothetical protein
LYRATPTSWSGRLTWFRPLKLLNLNCQTRNPIQSQAFFSICLWSVLIFKKNILNGHWFDILIFINSFFQIGWWCAGVSKIWFRELLCAFHKIIKISFINKQYYFYKISQLFLDSPILIAMKCLQE